jgi:serine/threonine protein kinase/Tfp pilus assembly protein PilF
MSAPAQDEKLCVESLVGQVADEFTERLNRGEHPDIEHYAERYPEIAHILRQALPALQAVGALAPGSLPSDEAALEQSPLTGCLGDFRLISQIGRGGMGVVYEAEQISLGRRVALKVLPFAAALDSKQLQRFKNEAHAAAGLQHTNIVPVYFVGCERGVHFYAMQFVEGQTLAAFIQELREVAGCKDRGSRIDDRGSQEKHLDLDPQRTGPFVAHEESRETSEERELKGKEAETTLIGLGCETVAVPSRSSILDSPSSFFRTVANLGIQAAEALEHAHQLGVIHRDIKPANLMVDARGNLWITDFGLAHCQGAVELTMSGDLLGTLRYMSPEQALAQRVLVDQRTDIYSLGVTLYELLTLEPAFPGTDRRELLRQIAFDDPKPPRRLSKAIPVELETIVVKALEKSPADRYATAQELADDLGRYLENKPIRARRTTLVQRVRKWARRHRSLVLVGTVALLVVLVASVLSTALIWRAYLSEADAHKTEASQRQQAQKSVKLAWNVLDGIYAQLMQIQPSADPETKLEQDALLKAALELYQQFAQESSTDPTVLEHVALAYAHIGNMHQGLAHYKEATEAKKLSLAILEQVVAEHPADPKYRRDLAAHYQNLAGSLGDEGELPAAIDCHQRAIGIAISLVEDFPGEPVHRERLAISYTALADCLRNQGQSEEAVKYYRLALDMETKLEKELADDRDFEHTLANLYHNLACTEEDLGSRVEAEKCYRLAIKILTKLVNKFPEPVARPGGRRWVMNTSADLQATLANSHRCLGQVLQGNHQLGDAKQHFDQAFRLWTQVCKKRPNQTFYRNNLARSFFNLGDLLEDTSPIQSNPRMVEGDLLGDRLQNSAPIQQVEENYRQAWYLCEKLSHDFPGYRQHGDIFADTAFALAHVLMQTGRSKEAKEICHKALELAPDDPEAHNTLAWQLSTCPDLELRDPNRAVKLAKMARDAHPRDAGYWNTLGAAQYRDGKFKAALEALDRSIQLSNDNPSDRFFAAMAHWQLEEKEQARKLYEKGEQVMRKGAPYIYDKVLLRVHAEAAKLLEIEGPPPNEKPDEITKP